MITKGRTGLWIIVGGLVAWIALKKLTAYFGISNLFWLVFGIMVLAVAAAFFWKPSFRQQPDPGEEEKIAA